MSALNGSVWIIVGVFKCLCKGEIISLWICVCVSVCCKELLMIEMIFEIEQGMGLLHWLNLEVSSGSKAFVRNRYDCPQCFSLTPVVIIIFYVLQMI